MASPSNMLSNVIGAPFSEYILTQLSIRANHNSSLQRTNDEVLFLANKSAWVKLTSSVNISLSGFDSTLQTFYQQILNPSIDGQVDPNGTSATDYTSADSLRKNWILEAGTSKATSNQDPTNPNNTISGINIRSGIGPDGAYGLGGTQELGYRPMPGLTSVEVDTIGTLGSLRQATIQFKVWNMNQLNVIETLYFRLGYSMILEWGHTQYYSNVGSNGNGTFTTPNIYGLDLFSKPLRKEEIQQKIAKQSADSSGNYQGMLGIVSNFTWSMNQEGGYDCNIKLIGLGAIIDSLKVNLSYKMPSVLRKIYDEQQAELKRQQEQEAERKRQQEASKQEGIIEQNRLSQGLTAKPVKTPTNKDEIFKNNGLSPYEVDFSVVAGNRPPSATEFFDQHAYYSADYQPNNETNTIPDYYYAAINVGNSNRANEINKHSGLFLSVVPGSQKIAGRADWTVIPADVSNDYPQPIYFNNVYFNLRTQQSIADTVSRTRDKPDAISDARSLVSNSEVLGRVIGYYNNAAQRAATYFGNFPIDFSLSNYQYYGISDQLLDASNIPLAYEKLLINSGVGKNEKIVKPVTVVIPYYGNIPNPNYTDTPVQKVFFIAIKYTPPPTGESHTPEELARTLDNWFVSRGSGVTPLLHITEIATEKTKEGYGDLYVVGSLKGFTSYNKEKVDPNLQLIFNDTQYITYLAPRPQEQQPNINIPGSANSGDTQGDINSTTSGQEASGLIYQSSLHIMLTFVKNQLLGAANKSTKAITEDSLLPVTKLFYNDGVLNEVLAGTFDSKEPSNSSITTTEAPAQLSNTFKVLEYALKGFNSNLMLGTPSIYNGDPSSNNNINEFYATIPTVKFEKLCKGYVVQYLHKDQTENQPQYLTYIKFGYLLAFLNNMCLIYDSTQDQERHPYVYLDFNPDTNFCLSNPNHLSVDPYTCLIPFTGNRIDYLNIFPKTLEKYMTTSPEIVNDLLITETVNLNSLSSQIPGFKEDLNQYQGKTMEILLNIDFLIDTLNQNITSDKEHSINLKGFLDAIVTGINKSVGNINVFRVAYRDDTNTVIIKDDQFVPPIAGESWALQSQNEQSLTTYGNTKSPAVPRYGMIPVFGLTSLVRDMQFQTNMSTAISNQIAISAQAQTGSTNSTDNSLFGYLNVGYQDAFKPLVGNVPPPQNASTQKQNEDALRIISSDLDQAQQFNLHIKSIYAPTTRLLSRDKVDMAVNYYINSMSQLKALDNVTAAAPFIPANLSITMDGIGGIVMGNAFTIPQDRLPNSLRSRDPKKTKVGFIVVGLTHIIENNQWLTRIRGQMIKLRDNVEYRSSNIPLIANPPVQANTATSSDNPRNTGLFIAKNSPKTSAYLFGTAKSGLDVAVPAHPNWGGISPIWQNNNAWDLGVTAGTPVYAIADGSISGTGFYENQKTVWGYKLTLIGNNSFFYTHLDSLVVKNGDSVKKGDLLGYVGQWPNDYPTNLQNFPHLHIGLQTGKLLTYIDNTGKLL